MEETKLGGEGKGFAPTLWSRVLAARRSKEALDALVRAYWKPVYFFVRRRGFGIEDAKDLTQGFFASLLERRSLLGVDPSRGRFRSFLLGALEHFLADERDRRGARKRGAPIPREDLDRVESQYRPEHSFDRDWALHVLEQAFVRFEREEPGSADLVRVLRGEKIPYADLARRLATTEGNVKVRVHRARKRLRGILLDVLRETVARPEDAERELRDLFDALS